MTVRPQCAVAPWPHLLCMKLPIQIIKVVLLTVLVNIGCVTTRLTCSLDALNESASALEVGVMMALFAFVPALCAIRCGLWIDMVGPKKPILYGIVIAGLAAAIPALFSIKSFGLVPLFLSCIINGVALMLIAMAVQHLIGILSEAKNRTTNFAILAMGFSAASFSAPIISGYIIDYFGFRISYFFAITTALLGLVLFLLRVQKALPAHWIPKNTSRHHSKFELMKIPHVRNVLIVSSFMSMAWDLQGFMIPVYGTAIGLTATEIGWILGFFASATFTIRFFMPWIAKHLTEWQTLTAAFGFGTLSYFLFPLFESFYALCGVAFLLGLALGSSQPNVMSLLHTESPEGRVGEALGLRTMLINICHTTLPILFGAAGAAVGAGAVFFAVATLMGGVTWFTTHCQKVSMSRNKRKILQTRQAHT